MDHAWIAREALRQYPVEVIAMEFVAQSGNAIYRVTGADNRQYCLRVHASRDGALDAIWSEPDVVASELEWMGAVAATTDITVPTPHRNVHGGYVTFVDGVPCSLLTWLDGEKKPYISDREDARTFIRLVAMLHRQASAWVAPVGFRRPVYDAGHITKFFGRIDGLPQGLYDRGDLEILRLAAQKAMRSMGAIERNGQTWGIIHGDLLPSNLLFSGGSIRLIDFGASGYGFFLFDIGIAFSFVAPESRRFFLDEYARHYPLPDDHVRLLETLYMAAQFDPLYFALGMSDTREWLPGFIHRLATREASHYLHDRPYLFEEKAFFQ